MLGRWVIVPFLGLAVVACGGSEEQAKRPIENPPPVDPPPDGPPPPPPVKAPVQVSAFTFWSKDQGLTSVIHDVSADEAGNVYVAGGEAIFAKRRDDADFRKFLPADAGLTENCWGEAEIKNPSPSGPPATCPIISVAGAAAGKAFVGYRGVGTDSDYDGPWALDSGGVDVLAWDGATLAKERHVFVASPPGVICEHWADPPANTRCEETWIDSTWMGGRKKMRQIQRIVVNHDAGRALSYGDAYFGGTHGSIAVLAAHPEERGWLDYIKGDTRWQDTYGVWEHEHPAILGSRGEFLSGDSFAIAIDPTTNVPWFANQFRTARLPGYVSMRRPSWNGWWGDMDPPSPFIAWWRGGELPDIGDANQRDNVTSLSFCDDGTLWVGSANHGLARRAVDGSVSYFELPSWTGNSVLAVACDPSDGSVWVGLGWGGFMRLGNGGWEAPPVGSPEWVARTPVRSIQIDRWASPRIVYFAHLGTPTTDGGVTAYRGP